MSYTVKQLSNLTGISVRTLHYYDEFGLLSPTRNKRNEYRIYSQNDLLILQQILFFKELDFSLSEIKKIILSKDFDVKSALIDHKKMIEIKRKRLKRLLKTIDETIKTINQNKKMSDNDLYSAFSKEEGEKYAQEAKERWGHTDAYKQSAERVKKMNKDDMKKIGEEGEDLLQRIIVLMDKQPSDPEVLKLISEHYNALRHFYEPNLEMYRGLASMYVDDERFKGFYEKKKVGLALFMRDAMHAYCDKEERK